MSLHRRSPRPIAGALKRSRGTWQPASPLGRAQTAWDEIGRVWAEVIGEHGPYIVERTTLVSLKAGVLTVRCSEAVVADTLGLESERVLRAPERASRRRSDHASAMRYGGLEDDTCDFCGVLQAKSRSCEASFRGPLCAIVLYTKLSTPRRAERLRVYRGVSTSIGGSLTNEDGAGAPRY